MIVIVVAVWAVALGVVFGRRRPEGIRSRVARSAVALLTGGAFVTAVGLRNAVSSLPLAIAVARLHRGRDRRVPRRSTASATAADRARLLWVGWGVSSWPASWARRGCSTRCSAGRTTSPRSRSAPSLVVPLALLLGSFERLVAAVDRILVLLDRGGRDRGDGRGRVPARGARVRRRTRPRAAARARTVDDRGRHRVARVCARCANRLADFANRRVYGRRQRARRGAADVRRAHVAVDRARRAAAAARGVAATVAAPAGGRGVDGHRRPARARRGRARSRARAGSGSTRKSSRWWPGRTCRGTRGCRCGCPACSAEHASRVVRVAPMAHSGELLGLLVCARAEGDAAFTEEEERVLTELARQVGLALHNSRLDTALQASLDDLRVANDELQRVASPHRGRRRPVAPPDRTQPARRRAATPGRARGEARVSPARSLEADPAAVATLLEELRGDAQATLTELRELAHGIYPPLLMDRGLPRGAAGRREPRACSRPRWPPMSAATTPRSRPRCTSVASKRCRTRASTRARVAHHRSIVRDGGCRAVLRSRRRRRRLRRDQRRARNGHGFVNMADRLGAIGGALEVDSAPGRGTRDPRPRPPPRALTRFRDEQSRREGALSRGVAARARARAPVRSPLCGRTRSHRQSRASAGRSASEYVDSRMTATSRFARRESGASPRCR